MMLKQLALVVMASILPLSTLGCVTTPTPVITADDGSVVNDFYFVFEAGSWFVEAKWWVEDGEWFFEAGYWDPRQHPEIFWTALDTKNNVIGLKIGDNPDAGSLGSVGYYSTQYSMPQARLQELYNDIIKHDIKSYSSPDVLSWYLDEGWGYAEKVWFYKFTFRINNEEYSIITDASVFHPMAPEKFRNFVEFASIVVNHCWRDTDEYRSLPEPIGDY